MADAESGTPGFLASFRRIGRSALALVQTRVELFAVELQEEKLRAINLFVWLTVALALGSAGIVVLVFVVGLFLWQRAGFGGVLALAFALLAAAAVLLWLLRRHLKRGPAPFAATMSEISKDVACLQEPE